MPNKREIIPFLYICCELIAFYKSRLCGASFAAMYRCKIHSQLPETFVETKTVLQQVGEI